MVAIMVEVLRACARVRPDLLHVGLPCFSQPERYTTMWRGQNVSQIKFSYRSEMKTCTEDGCILCRIRVGLRLD